MHADEARTHLEAPTAIQVSAKEKNKLHLRFVVM